ncbi:MAG: hypothetical protein RIF46_01455 [Cyclobacteriaceae bacterium]
MKKDTINRFFLTHCLGMIAALAFITVAASQTLAQTDTSITETVRYRVITLEGNEYLGEVVSDDGREVLMITDDLGKIYIPKSTIASMKPARQEDSVFKGSFRDVGPFTTRYYFTNNALPIHKGEHYMMIHLYGPEVHFAVSDRLSVGVMATWIASPVGLAAKYAIPTSNEKLNFSIGSIVLSSGYLVQGKGYGGIHWLSATYGKPGKNFTVSGGYAYADFGFDRRHELRYLGDRLRHGPVFSAAGLLPIGKKASLLFDSMTFFTTHHNYEDIYPTSFDYTDVLFVWKSGAKMSTVLMPGMRFQKSERAAFQVALAGMIEYSEIGFNYREGTSDTRSVPIPMCSLFLKL